MQALLLHRKPHPGLGRGVAVLPIKRWEQVAVSFRILRAHERASRASPSAFVTLCAIPAHHPVAVIRGDVRYTAAELEYAPLDALSEEDQRLLAESFEKLEREPPRLSSASAGWVARLVLGEPLPASAVKWTKDIRLLEGERRNSSTKRR